MKDLSEVRLIPACKFSCLQSLQPRLSAPGKAGVTEGGDWGGGGEGVARRGCRGGRGPIGARPAGGQSAAASPGKSAPQCGAGLPRVGAPRYTSERLRGAQGTGSVCPEPGERRPAQLLCQPRDIPRRLNQGDDGASWRSRAGRHTGWSTGCGGT